MPAVDAPTLTLHSGHSIPQLGLGTYLLDGEVCERVVSAALERGYRHIDTAAVYGNELAVGNAIRASGLSRDELFITTKLANSAQHDPLGGFERSLDRLGLDSVDLYLIHWPLPRRNTSIPAWRALDTIAASGRARSIGVCNYEVDHLEELIEATGVVPAVNQIELHPEHQRADIVAFCREHDILVEAWGPLAQSKSDLLSKPEILRIASEHGRTPAQVILRWHVERGHIVIPKTAREERLDENANLFDFELTAADHAVIDALEAARNYGPDPRTYDG